MTTSPEPLSPQRRWLTLGVVALGVFVTALDNSIVNVALPSIQRDLHLDLAGVAWIVNSYIVAYAMLLLTAGRLADIFGRRRLFLVGIAAFTAASLAAGLAQTATELIAARAVQGLGAALLTPPTLAILDHAFREPKARGTAIGIWGAVAALGFAVGPISGGLITEHLHWMWIFFVNVPVGAVAIVVGSRVIRESTDPGTSRRLDVAGLTTSAMALSALTYALLNANQRGWGSPVIVVLLAVAAASTVGFVAVELRSAAPAVDLRLFRRPDFSGANLAILTFNLGTFGVFLYTSLYFQDVLGYSPVKAGSALLPWILVLIVLGPFTGALAERVTPRRLVAGGLLVMAVGLALLSGIDEHSAYVDLLPGLVLGGVGGALTIPLSGVAIAAAPAEKAGVASGVFNTARETGGALGIAIIGALVASPRHPATPEAALHDFAVGYGRGLTVAALLAVAAAIVAALTLGEPREGSTSAPAGVIPEAA
jgi:EmrB/QacA subfamily drug resistance transporter